MLYMQFYAVINAYMYVWASQESLKRLYSSDLLLKHVWGLQGTAEPLPRESSSLPEWTDGFCECLRMDVWMDERQSDVDMDCQADWLIDCSGEDV